MLKKIWAVLKKIWLDPIWSKVISVGVIALIVALGAYLSNYWLDYWGKIAAVCIRLLTFFNQGITIPLWVIIIAIPALIMAIPVIIRFLPERKPKFTRYVNDNIFDVAWHWSWEKLAHYVDKLYVWGSRRDAQSAKASLK